MCATCAKSSSLIQQFSTISTILHYRISLSSLHTPFLHILLENLQLLAFASLLRPSTIARPLLELQTQLPCLFCNINCPPGASLRRRITSSLILLLASSLLLDKNHIFNPVWFRRLASCRLVAPPCFVPMLAQKEMSQQPGFANPMYAVHDRQFVMPPPLSMEPPPQLERNGQSLPTPSSTSAAPSTSVPTEVEEPPSTSSVMNGKKYRWGHGPMHFV